MKIYITICGYVRISILMFFLWQIEKYQSITFFYLCCQVTDVILSDAHSFREVIWFLFVTLTCKIWLDFLEKEQTSVVHLFFSFDFLTVIVILSMVLMLFLEYRSLKFVISTNDMCSIVCIQNKKKNFTIFFRGRMEMWNILHVSLWVLTFVRTLINFFVLWENISLFAHWYFAQLVDILSFRK